MFRDLLVATTGGPGDHAAVAAACAMAQGRGGHVTVLVHERIVALPDAGLGFLAASAYAEMIERVRRDAEAECARWNEVLRHAGVAGEARLGTDVLLRPAQASARQARLADVSLVGLGPPGELPVEAHDEIAGLLADSGRPVLVVPEGHAPSPFSRVLIAWRPGANATRAIHEALPLLARAAEVVVLCVDPPPAADGEAPGSDLVRHLARHEVNARVRVEAGVGEEPGAVLLRVARDSAADLLVMGGYGHSRWREWMFGGTTRHVLRHATLPVLMSH